MAETHIVQSLRQKVFEAIDRTQHLVSLVPADQVAWLPTSPHTQIAVLDMGHLLGHLLECMAGFCAAFYAAFPRELEEISTLRWLSVNHSCAPQEANARIDQYAGHIAQAFKRCQDADLDRRVPTVFIPAGETLALLLLGNLEHLLNHKYQLFFYLKLMGIRVGTPDLYHWRGAALGR